MIGGGHLKYSPCKGKSPLKFSFCFMDLRIKIIIIENRVSLASYILFSVQSVQPLNITQTP